MPKIYSSKVFLFLCLLIITIHFCPLSAQISTFAGRHTYLGDGNAATSAGLFGPYGLARDTAGNLYIATVNDNRVRKVDAVTHNIATIAGTGIAGFAGDGGAATSAQLHFNNGLPGIAVDKAGNIYIGDCVNNRVRKIDAITHNISTVAGTGTGGYSGDGGSAVTAKLSGPAGIVTDAAGNVYFADNNNNAIREINIATGVISTVAGNGIPGYSGDGGLATAATLSYPERFTIDSKGNMYISDAGNSVIRKVDATTKKISTVVGNGTDGFSGDGGLATSASLSYTMGVTVDTSGNIFIADQTNNRIREVVASTGKISTIAGTGVATYGGDGALAVNAQVNIPTELLIDNAGNLYVEDLGNNRIREINASTKIISTIAGDGSNGFTGVPSALQAQLAPQAISIDPSGNFYIADGYYYDVRAVNIASNSYIYAGNPNPDPKYASKGYSGNGGLASAAFLNAPFGVAVDAANNIYIADVFNNVVRKIAYNTKYITTVAGNATAGYSGDGAAATSAALNTPYGITVDGKNNIYIADAGNNRIRKVDGTTLVISTIAGTGTGGFAGDGGVAASAQINNPYGVAADGTGNIFFIDKGNARVRMIAATTNIISTILNNSHVLTGIAIDKSGNIYVSDSTSSSILKITAGTFAVQTVAGTGTAGFSGDGGAATSGQLNYPRGLVLDGSGNIYVADVNNNVIRKIIPSTTVTPAITNNIISTVDSVSTCIGKINLTTLGGTVPAGGTGSYTYQWLQSSDSVIYTAISGASSQNYAVNAAITATTFYRRLVTSGTVKDSANVLSFHPRSSPAPVITQSTTALCQGSNDTLSAPAGYAKYAWSTGAVAQKIIDTISGTFYVAVTDAYGCKGQSATLSLTVRSLPVPTITLKGTTTFCSGTKDSLIAAAGYTKYAWNRGDAAQKIADSLSGTFYVTVTDSYGCQGTSASMILTAKPSPVPTISLGTGSSNFCAGSKDTLTASSGYLKYAWNRGDATQKIVDSVTYTFYVTVTDSFGCQGKSASLLLVSKALPVPKVTLTGAATFCSGAYKDTLTATAGYTKYAWNNSYATQKIPVTASGTFYVAVTDSFGCKGTSASTVITVNALPATPVITSSPFITTNLCAGTPVTLTSSAATSYKWSTGATTSSVSLKTAGAYTVTVANAAGCKATSAAIAISYAACVMPAATTTSGITATGVTLKWSKASCAVKYMLQYAKAGSTTWSTITTSTADTSYNLTKLTKSTSYQWRVATVCLASPSTVSAYTNTATFTTPASFASDQSPVVFTSEASAVYGNEFDATVFPNPAINTANLKISGLTGKVAVIVSDMSGRILWQSQKVTDTQLAIPVNMLARGMYFITVKDGKHNNKVLKLIKE